MFGEQAGSKDHMIGNFFIKVVLNVTIYTYLESSYYKLLKYVYIITFSLTFMKKIIKFVNHVTLLPASSPTFKPKMTAIVVSSSTCVSKYSNILSLKL